MINEAVLPQTIDHAIEAVAKVIDRAKKELLISTGSLGYQCYENERVYNALERAKGRNVNIFVLTGPQIDEKSFRVINLLRDDIFQLSNEPNVHFTIADGKDFRLEKLDPRDDGIYLNDVRYNDRLNGSYLREKFLDALKHSVGAPALCPQSI